MPMPPPPHEPDRKPVLGLRLTTMIQEEIVDQMLAWAEAGESRMVCTAQVPMVMAAQNDPEFRQMVNGADLVVPDATPLVWARRRQGLPWLDRVHGRELMLEVCRRASQRGTLVGLYGARQDVLGRVVSHLQARFPGLIIAYAGSAPRLALSVREHAELVADIRRSGVAILLLGLGCPAQERWMAASRSQLPAVMLGVGAAFEHHASPLLKSRRWLRRPGPVGPWVRTLQQHVHFLTLLARSRPRVAREMQL